MVLYIKYSLWEGKKEDREGGKLLLAWAGAELWVLTLYFTAPSGKYLVHNTMMKPCSGKMSQHSKPF
jgi:hypothetical protein